MDCFLSPTAKRKRGSSGSPRTAWRPLPTGRGPPVRGPEVRLHLAAQPAQGGLVSDGGAAGVGRDDAGQLQRAVQQRLADGAEGLAEAILPGAWKRAGQRLEARQPL